VALIKGKVSSGTGFLVKQGLLATNAHVLKAEFLSSFEVRFPSAPAGAQGPLKPTVLFTDPKRDLAFFSIQSGLPPVQLVPAYQFVRGEDVTVIGNPGLGDERVLENAISKGVMSSKTVLNEQSFLQLGIAVNPGNSGGPVFDSMGRVIGVITLKSTKLEGMAFCIPAEDVNEALSRLDAQPSSVPAQLVSRHRTELAFQLLTNAGALYAVGSEARGSLMRSSPNGTIVAAQLPEELKKFDEAIRELESKLYSQLGTQMPALQNDQSIKLPTRRLFHELASSYRDLKGLYAVSSGPVDQYLSRVGSQKAQHLNLVLALERELKMPVPPKVLAQLRAQPSESQPTLIAEFVPPAYRSRFPGGIGGFPGRMPMGPIGPRLPGASDRLQQMRERMDALRFRARAGFPGH